MNKHKENIFALSTPAGKSAIAVVRISGTDSFNIVNKMSTNMPRIPNNAKLNTIKLSNNNKIDQTITTYFKAPKSYTGEDMVEISIHGGGAVIKKVLNALGNNNNTRIAEPGEFTRRAFENNKLDLTQVEAIADLVNSETESQRKQAIRQLEGQLTKKTKKFSDKILKILADAEAIIDFSDDELPKNLIKDIKEQIENIILEITNFLKEGSVGEKIRTGFIIAVVGKTNTGKSSFINKVAKREISIVTDEPGTTRDLLELFVDFRGYPVKFYDTAGFRQFNNKAEEIGIKKAHNLTGLADINLVFIENMQDIYNYESINNKIFVKSKSDIRNKIHNRKIFNISSISGDGFEHLFNNIYHTLENEIQEEDPNVSRERHRNALKNTLKYLENSKNIKNFDVFAEDIRLAMREISKISGNVDIEDILEVIFNDFCIGK